MLVSGRVQAVGFRWHCRNQAVERGLAGFVRNLSDGQVEAVFEGIPEDVEAMVDWCRTGPSMAEVDSIDVREETPAGEEQFRIVR